MERHLDSGRSDSGRGSAKHKRSPLRYCPGLREGSVADVLDAWVEEMSLTKLATPVADRDEARLLRSLHTGAITCRFLPPSRVKKNRLRVPSCVSLGRASPFVTTSTA